LLRGVKHASFCLKIVGKGIVCETRIFHQPGHFQFLKTRRIHQPAVQILPRGQAGMTLVEVVLALAIAGLMMGGIVTGYVYCATASVKDSLYMAANARMMERIEETRSARWDTSSWPVTDQLVATNFPDKTVTLDMSGSGTNVINATLVTTISQISTLPPVRQIRVDCIWQFQGGEWITNTIETCRAPDQ
jgi:prepilin-type N-terminal cleavage/methylation domain-containing protein